MKTIDEKPYRELRCKACHKMICYEYIFDGRVAFACPRCGELSTYHFKHLPTKENIDKMNTDIINLPYMKRG